MEKITLKPVFVETKNVHDFNFMMAGLNLAAGEGRLGCVSSPPGRGKTVTAQVWGANNGGVYFRVASIWKRSELDFIQALCIELGITSPPGRKGRCHSLAVERLAGTDRAVFVDEVQRLPKDFLNVVLDLSDATACPFVLIGEEELKTLMQQNRRVWSRTYHRLEFEPITKSDIAVYAGQAAGLKLSPIVTSILLKDSSGDFRIVRRDMLALVQLANARQVREIDEEMAQIAIRTGLKGTEAGNGH